MDFYVLFTLVSRLTFDIQFQILDDDVQDFLFFEGVNSSAHLRRENRTVFLYLRKVAEYDIYQIEIVDHLDFSWEGFKVNGTPVGGKQGLWDKKVS